MGHVNDTTQYLEHAPARDAPVRPTAPVWTATGREPQVFLDRTGRRARRVGVAGALAAVLSTGWLGGVIGGSAGFASLPALHAQPLIAHVTARSAAHHGHGRHRHTHTVEVADLGSTRG